jgi:hypothetical protein
VALMIRGELMSCRTLGGGPKLLSSGIRGSKAPSNSTIEHEPVFSEAWFQYIFSHPSFDFHLVKIYIDGLRGSWNGPLRASWRKSFLHEEEAGKNKKPKGIDHFWNCHMVSTPLAPLPSGTDLSESLKTSVTRMKQALQPRVRSEAAF